MKLGCTGLCLFGALLPTLTFAAEAPFYCDPWQGAVGRARDSYGLTCTEVPGVGNTPKSSPELSAYALAASSSTYAPTGEASCVPYYAQMTYPPFLYACNVPVRKFNPPGNYLRTFYIQGFCASSPDVLPYKAPIYGSDGKLYCRNDEVPTVTLSGISEIRPVGTGGTSTITFTAKTTTPNGQPKAGVALNFSADVKPNSGGHEHAHDATRKKGSVLPPQGVTNASGELVVTFKAEEAAGIHTVKAICPSCSNKEVSKEIQVKVPGLIELGADTGKPPEYALVGAISNKHTSNHWFTPTATRQLDKVVGLMYETGWGQVGINDGSLIWGGLFDVKEAWETPHTGHRLGTEVDISFKNPKAISEFQRKKTYSELCKKDNAALGVQTLWHEDDAYPDHFHIYLTGQGLTSKAGDGPCCMSYVKWEPVLNKDKTPVIGKDGKPKLKAVSYCEETTPR